MTDTITLLSWNVNGIRAVHKKGFLDWLAEADPDILCLQETRAGEDQLPAKLAQPDGYRGYWNGAKRKKGYSGTGLLTRPEPLSVEYGLGIEEFDQEGRTIIATYPTFTLLNCYFPNGGRDHSRVPFKLAFYDAFLEKCERLRSQGQAVIFCGDVNTSHREIDLARPKDNQKTTGFLPEERAWIDAFLADGWVDSFRAVNAFILLTHTLICTDQPFFFLIGGIEVHRLHVLFVQRKRELERKHLVDSNKTRPFASLNRDIFPTGNFLGFNRLIT